MMVMFLEVSQKNYLFSQYQTLLAVIFIFIRHSEVKKSCYFICSEFSFSDLVYGHFKLPNQSECFSKLFLTLLCFWVFSLFLSLTLDTVFHHMVMFFFQN
jgi:hypothetical protein